MRFLSSIALTLVAGALTLGAASSAKADTATPRPASCPEGEICLYDGTNDQGEWNRHGCDRKSVPFVDTGSSFGRWLKSKFSNSDDTNTDRQDAEFLNRVSSIYNGCDHSWALYTKDGYRVEIPARTAYSDLSKFPSPGVTPADGRPLTVDHDNANIWLTDPGRVVGYPG